MSLLCKIHPSLDNSCWASLADTSVGDLCSRNYSKKERISFLRMLADGKAVCMSSVPFTGHCDYWPNQPVSYMDVHHPPPPTPPLFRSTEQRMALLVVQNMAYWTQDRGPEGCPQLEYGPRRKPEPLDNHLLYNVISRNVCWGRLEDQMVNFCLQLRS